MIIYNVTVKIEKEINDDWLKWMKDEHIPEVLGTGMFTENRILKVLVDETDGITYSVQYYCKSMDDYEKYLVQFAPELQKKHTNRYKDKFVAFRTLLEILD
jgi:hypothetical protein